MLTNRLLEFAMFLMIFMFAMVALSTMFVTA